MKSLGVPGEGRGEAQNERRLPPSRTRGDCKPGHSVTAPCSEWCCLLCAPAESITGALGQDRNGHSRGAHGCLRHPLPCLHGPTFQRKQSLKSHSQQLGEPEIQARPTAPAGRSSGSSPRPVGLFTLYLEYPGVRGQPGGRAAAAPFQARKPGGPLRGTSQEKRFNSTGFQLSGTVHLQPPST